MIAAARTRLAQDSGFTLIELMVSVMIGIVVLLGITNLIDATGRANTRLTDKTETVQRTRIAMDRIVRILRTQACPDTLTPPIKTGTANSIEFYSDTGSTPTFAPRLVRLSYDSTFRDASNKVVGAIKQELLSSTGTVTGTRVLIDNVAPAGGSLFTYYSFADLNLPYTALNNSLATNPLPANSIAKIVKIDAGIRGRPTSGKIDSRRETSATSSVYTRSADFSVSPETGRKWGPRC